MVDVDKATALAEALDLPRFLADLPTLSGDSQAEVALGKLLRFRWAGQQFRYCLAGLEAGSVETLTAAYVEHIRGPLGHTEARWWIEHPDGIEEARSLRKVAGE